MRRLAVWPLVIIASGLGAGLAALGFIGPPLRPLLAFWFLLVCPGIAFVRLLQLEEPLSELTLAIALSIALDSIVAEIMAFSHHWSPLGALGVLVALSLVGVALQIRLARTREGKRCAVDDDTESKSARGLQLSGSGEHEDVRERENSALGDGEEDRYLVVLGSVDEIT